MRERERAQFGFIFNNLVSVAAVNMVNGITVNGLGEATMDVVHANIN